MVDQFKRNIAYKLKIGNVLSGKVVLENEKFKTLELGDKSIMRVNLIANVVDKYSQEGEKKFGSITLDDASGQIKAKTFGDDVDKHFAGLNQGDTIQLIGMLKYWNKEVYVTPEIIKKKDPSFLLVRKLEVEADQPKNLHKEALTALKDKIIDLLKVSEKDNGIDIEKLITDLQEHPDIINNEIKKLLEEGVAYEPRPGRLRYLG